MSSTKQFEIVGTHIAITGTGDALRQGERYTAAKLTERGVNSESLDRLTRIGAIREYTEPVVQGAEKSDSEEAASKRVAELEGENAVLKAKIAELEVAAELQSAKAATPPAMNPTPNAAPAQNPRNSR